MILPSQWLTNRVDQVKGAINGIMVCLMLTTLVLCIRACIAML